MKKQIKEDKNVRCENRSNEMAKSDRKIWAIADDVRGAVDGWDFAKYILGILFYRLYRRILQSFLTRRNMEAGDLEFDYANITTRKLTGTLDQIR